MILALDVGNSQMLAGVIERTIDGPVIRARFRRHSKSGASSDEHGLFFREVLRENDIDPSKINEVAICSVVPDVMYSLKASFQKYFKRTPFVLQAGVKTGLRVKYRNPVEVGADRIANAIGATSRFPDKNLVVVDLGTATTFCAITREKDYLGGTIIAGMRISGEALESKTAKLPSVEILSPEQALGRSTIESIQSGLYYGHLGAMREIISRFQEEVFKGEKPFVIGTGGFSKLFEGAGIFDVDMPDLVLLGLYDALQMNEGSTQS